MFLPCINMSQPHVYMCLPHPEPPFHLLSCFPSWSTFFFSFKVYLASHSSSVMIASYRTLLLYSSIFSFPFFGFIISILMPLIDMFQVQQCSAIMIPLCNLCLLRKQEADRKWAHTCGPSFTRLPPFRQTFLFISRELSGVKWAPEPWAALPGTELLQQGAEVRGEEREQHWQSF